MPRIASIYLTPEHMSKLNALAERECRTAKSQAAYMLAQMLDDVASVTPFPPFLRERLNAYLADTPELKRADLLVDFLGEAAAADARREA